MGNAYVELPPTNFTPDRATALCSAGQNPAPAQSCQDFESFILAYPEAASRQGEGLSVAGLVQFIEVCQLTTQEQVIERLPLRFRQSYVFMPESRSRQESTPDQPRAILYGSDAKFVLTFTGNNALHAGTDLELIEWNDETARFTPSYLSFTGATGSTPPDGPMNERCGAQGHPLPVTITHESSRCLGCHESSMENFHPIWAGYNVWLGAYGSISDGNADFMHSGQSEAHDYAHFISGPRHEGRYAALPTPALPEDPLTIATAAGVTPYLSVPRNADPDPDKAGLPTSRLLKHYNELNPLRIGARIAEANGPYAAFVVALGNQCVDTCDALQVQHEPCGGNYGDLFALTRLSLDEFFPPIQAAEFRSRQGSWFSEIGATGRAENAERFTYLEGVNEGWLILPQLDVRLFEDTAPYQRMMQFELSPLYAVGEALDLPVQTWSLDPQGLGTYNLASSRGLAISFLVRVAEAVLDRNPHLRGMSCRELADFSRSGF